MTEGVRRVALITGASRGVGASIATMLADRGFNVVINYHSKRSRAEDVAANVQARGGRALIVQADLTKSHETSAMVSTIGKTFGRLDALVLNASGGLEKGKPPEYAMDLNLTAQIGLVGASLPLIRRGGRIVFITSHMAHFYAERGMVGPYLTHFPSPVRRHAFSPRHSTKHTICNRASRSNARRAALLLKRYDHRILREYSANSICIYSDEPAHDPSKNHDPATAIHHTGKRRGLR
jgi:NAD(P)-dependent dehydrogenase (short-subunit alcohol dehydrogenase family)